jgi:transcriptional regulator with XRE-family HTH domain
MSLEELAERSQLDREAIVRILRCETEARLETIYLLAGGLGVDPGKLFEGIAWIPDDEDGGRYAIEDPDGD